MANQKEPPEFTKPQLDQLLWYIEQSERDGAYYGNFFQFMSRHNDIKNKIAIIRMSKGNTHEQTKKG